jgi:hypothetical protein
MGIESLLQALKAKQIEPIEDNLREGDTVVINDTDHKNQAFEVLLYRPPSLIGSCSRTDILILRRNNGNGSNTFIFTNINDKRVQKNST